MLNALTNVRFWGQSGRLTNGIGRPTLKRFDGSFVVHSYSNDDWAACRDYVRDLIGPAGSTKQPLRMVLPHETEKNLGRARHLFPVSETAPQFAPQSTWRSTKRAKRLGGVARSSRQIFPAAGGLPDSTVQNRVSMAQRGTDESRVRPRIGSWHCCLCGGLQQSCAGNAALADWPRHLQDIGPHAVRRHGIRKRRCPLRSEHNVRVFLSSCWF